MRIALVYDLRDDYRALGFSEEEIAEFDNIDTIDQLDGALRALRCEVVRVGRGQVLAARLAAGERFDLVFSIAEGLKGRSREAQVPALCELFDQPYLLSDPLTSAVALDKAVAKRLVRDAGVPTPAFMVANVGCERACRLERVSGLRQADRGRDRQGLRVRLGGEFIGGACRRGREAARALPPAGAGRDLSARPRVHRRHRRQRRGGEACSASARSCSRRMPRPISTRCTTRSFARSWSSTNAPTTRRRVLPGRARLPPIMRFECRDAARIDFRSNASGEPYFLEANPLAGLHPHHSDLPILAAQNGVPYVELIGMILDAGLARYGLARPGTERARRRA